MRKIRRTGGATNMGYAAKLGSSGPGWIVEKGRATVSTSTTSTYNFTKVKSPQIVFAVVTKGNSYFRTIVYNKWLGNLVYVNTGSDVTDYPDVLMVAKNSSETLGRYYNRTYDYTTTTQGLIYPYSTYLLITKTNSTALSNYGSNMKWTAIQIINANDNDFY